MVNVLGRADLEGMYLYIIEAIYDKATATVIPSGEELRVIP
jgi:hypothetical protein